MTINRTQSDLNKLLKKAIEQVEAQGLEPGPIDENLELSNAAKEMGRCTKEIVGFTIRISKYIKDSAEKDLMDTLVHEVLHTVPGCFNHGAQWKAAADRMNKAYNYDIERLSTASVANLTDEHRAILKRYVIKCHDCGHEIYRQRKSKLVNFPELYTCGCGGELCRIK